MLGSNLTAGVARGLVLRNAGWNALVPPVARIEVDPALNPAWEIVFAPDRIDFRAQPDVTFLESGVPRVVDVLPGVYAASVRTAAGDRVFAGERVVSAVESNQVAFAIGPRIAGHGPPDPVTRRIRIDIVAVFDLSLPAITVELVVQGDAYVRLPAFTGNPPSMTAPSSSIRQGWCCSRCSTRWCRAFTPCVWSPTAPRRSPSGSRSERWPRPPPSASVEIGAGAHPGNGAGSDRRAGAPGAAGRHRGRPGGRRGAARRPGRRGAVAAGGSLRLVGHGHGSARPGVRARRRPGLAEAYAAAQGAPHRVCPTEALARRLFDRAAEAGGNEPVWRAGAPLAVWGFLVPIARTAGEPDSFEADPRVIDWLRGMIGLDAALVSRAHLVEPQRPFAAWPVAATLRNVVRALEAGRPVRVVVTGPAGSGRATFAAAVAAGVNRRALVIDPAGAEDFPELLMRARRLARMADFVLVWRHHEGLRLPRHPPAPPLECVAAGPRARVAPVEGTTDLVAPLPSPDRDERKALWRRLVSEAAAWPASALDALAARPGVAVGDIVEVARGVPQGPDDALARLRARARAWLGDAARALTPRLRWDDLVLPAPTREALEEIAFETAARLRLLAEPEAGRLYAHSGVLAALFSGPPGTGKTMAAEAIADSLGADLLLVDVAATVSKYIGETAKNSSRAFDEAAASGAILLFDEADALFAKRTEIKDSHDRHANADTNYLLHLLENFDGLAILATNRRANMDPAFVRRIRHVVEFARPAAAERRVIWRRAVAALAGEERAAALGGLLDALADQHELTAAQIKNAALTARYAAMREGGPITEAQIRRGLGRELIKDGRPADAPARGARGRNG